MQITFLGAADTVTGSKHLVNIGGQRILLDRSEEHTSELQSR